MRLLAIRPGRSKTAAKYTRKGYAVVVRGLKPQQHTQAVYRFAQNDIAAYIVLAQRRNYISA